MRHTSHTIQTTERLLRLAALGKRASATNQTKDTTNNKKRKCWKGSGSCCVGWRRDSSWERVYSFFYIVLSLFPRFVRRDGFCLEEPQRPAQTTWSHVTSPCRAPVLRCIYRNDNFPRKLRARVTRWLLRNLWTNKPTWLTRLFLASLFLVGVSFTLCLKSTW